MNDHYLENVKIQFEYYKALGRKTINALDDQELFYQPNEQSNSIGIMVNHLWGNMMSRWTDLFTADGEKTWRQRDQEFEAIIKTRAELLKKWEEGWNCLFGALDSMNESNYDQKIFIRNQAHTLVEAINRQICHYSYHVGQMVYLGKVIKGKDWKSLSIPKGNSKDFNKKMFSKGKHEGHFTDDII